MLSRQSAHERRERRDWMCSAIGALDDYPNMERESHYCTLEKLHFGPHICWCGWSFKLDMVSWRQPLLPLDDQPRAT